MPLLTSRIEKELIFSSFTVTKPELFVRGREISVRIPYDDYLSEVNCITLLKNEHFFAGCEVVVSFFYKKAKIFFKTIIERENTIFFRIPQDIHVLKKKKKRHKFPSMSLYYQNFLLSIFASSGVRTLPKEKTEQMSDVKNIFAQSASMGHDMVYLLTEMKQCIPAGCDLYSHLDIISSFLEVRKKKEIKGGMKKNLYIFSDSNLILLFSSKNLALQFSSDRQKKFKANIVFKDRNITCEVQYSFFSPFGKKRRIGEKEIYENTKIESSFGFLGLKIINIQEEDRRYLYERVFSNHYKEKL